MDPTLTEQMLDALELFHYSSSFRDRVFALIVQRPEDLEQVLLDLKVLQSSHIRTVVICPDCATIESRIAPWNLSGHRFDLVKISDSGETQEQLKQITSSLEQSRVALVIAPSVNGADETLETKSFYLGSRLHASKVFILGAQQGLEVEGKLISCPSGEEIQELLADRRMLNMDRARLQFLHKSQREFGFDIVILNHCSGSLFTEIFTHRGAGTLLTNDHPTVLRRASDDDVASIGLLMLPYVQEGSILHMSDTELLASITSFHVYSIHDQIIASAMLNEHGSASEIGKLCTLPRYRGKGRAGSLIQHLIECARAAQKEYLFTLTIDSRVGEFFQSFGFAEIDRTSLPQSWQQQYDFSRPSRAFKLQLA